MIEKANRIIYVTDISQGSHFKMVFNTAKLAKYIPDDTIIEHVGFGLVLGEDGKRLRSRSGDTYPLRDLLNESIKHAKEILTQKRVNNQSQNEWSEEKINLISQIIGIGAIKYFDLSLNRESGYKFSFNKMLALDGNTAPYMLYTYARIHGIYRKSSLLNHNQKHILENSNNSDINNNKNNQIQSQLLFQLNTKEELQLSVHLIRFYEVINEISVKSNPNRVSYFNY